MFKDNLRVNVSFFKIRSYGFPESYLGIKLFNFAPGRIANSFAVDFSVIIELRFQNEKRQDSKSNDNSSYSWL